MTTDLGGKTRGEVLVSKRRLQEGGRDPVSKAAEKLKQQFSIKFGSEMVKIIT